METLATRLRRDVGRVHYRRGIATTIEKFGGVDLLFINAGGPPAGTALSFDDEAWTSAFDLLVLSAVRMVRLAVPSMKARGGGAIVVSTSSAVKEPIPNLALSNVVRASVAAMSKTLSNELAADSIRVNHLLPGRIDTDRVRELDTLRGKATGASAGRGTRRATRQDHPARPVRRAGGVRQRPRCSCSPTPRGTSLARRCRSTEG